MGILKIIREKRFVVCCVLLTILLPLLFPQAANAASTAVITLEAEQVFVEPEGSEAADEFTYTLMALDSGSPMPDGINGDTYTFPISGTDKVTIGTITYRTTGTYNYIIKQTTESKHTGYTYDPQEYSIKVVVDDDSGNLRAVMEIYNVEE